MFFESHLQPFSVSINCRKVGVLRVCASLTREAKQRLITRQSVSMEMILMKMYEHQNGRVWEILGRRLTLTWAGKMAKLPKEI